MGESLGREAARERIEDLERPALDDRAYRIVTLPNQLEVLLIHDAKTDKASAAMDVNVGSFSDMPDMPGIAHAVEHLLFMGTEKYPKENAYNQFLTAHSGHSNAYTASTSTNYYFELAASASTPSSSKAQTPSTSQEKLVTPKDESPLWGALDRFGQFFICPLFLEDTVDREIKAVDSENKKNLQSDTWRLHQLNKALSNPNHPYCNFSTGNWVTLHDDPIARGVKIRDAFIKFHSEHYSANRMKLVILGREDLDTLEQWADEIFSQVKNKNLPRKRWDGVSVYTDQELLTQTFARPVLDSRTLELSFLFRDEEEFYESHPSRYLSHLIGHEGPGSILAYIKAKGWANGLGAGGQSLCPGSGIFNISVKLTEDGLKHYREVTKIIFQYIAMIREQAPQKWIVDEQIRISEVDFRFKQKNPPSKTTSALASVMQKPYQRKQLLSGPATIKKFDAELISQAMEYLRPDNFRMTVVSQQFPGDWDQKEKWYGTEYKTNKIPEDVLADIRQAFQSKDRPAELHFPHKNEFIPNNLEVEKKDVAEPSRSPRLIRNDGHVRTWYKKDDQFWVPKANVYVLFRTPIPQATPRTAAMTCIYRELVSDALVEYSYDADISGLVYEFNNHNQAMSISLEGYNDKIQVLLEKVLLQVRDLEVREDRFKVIVDRISRGFRNWDYGQPFHQVGTYSRWLKLERGYMTEDFLRELEEISARDVQEFYPQILAECHVEVLAHGNLYKEEALQITDLIEKTLKPRKLLPNHWPIKRTVLLPPGSNFIYERRLKDPANVNHCIEYSLLVGHRQDRHLCAKLLLIAQLTDEPAFNQLRTIEQLGYVVFSGVSVADSWAGYRILIQSEKDCRYLEGRIEHFLSTFEKTLEEMSNDEFESQKRAVISQRSEKLKNLSQEGARFWNHMFNDGYDFEQSYEDVKNVEPITKDEMKAFFAQYISPSSLKRAKLSVHLIAQAKPKEPSADEKRVQALDIVTNVLKGEKIIADLEELKKKIATIAEPTATNLSETISAYITSQISLPKEQSDKVVDEVKAALGVAEVDSKLEDPQVLHNDVPGTISDSRAPVLITDVHAFKAGLQLSTGIRPVKDLGEFVEGSAKL